MNELLFSEAILKHLASEAATGFLFGENGNVKKADDFLSISNGIEAANDGLLPENYRHALQYAADSGKDLLGVFFTRKNLPAVPLATEFESSIPFLSHVFLSLGGGNLVAMTSWIWKIEEERFEEESLRLYTEERMINDRQPVFDKLPL